MTNDRAPWQMTRIEWDRALAANRPEHFGSSTRGGASQASARMHRLEFLLDGVRTPAGTIEGFRGPRPVTHMDVVAAAMQRGEAVPAYVLADYQLQCQCGHDAGEHISPAIDLGLPVSRDMCQWGACSCREFAQSLATRDIAEWGRSAPPDGGTEVEVGYEREAK